MTILFLNLQITRSEIRPHIKWAVTLVIAYGHFNLPRGFVWVCSHFVNPEGGRTDREGMKMCVFEMSWKGWKHESEQ